MIEEIKDLMTQAKDKALENSNEITKVKTELGEVKNYLEQNRPRPTIFVTSNAKEVGPYLSLKGYREKVKSSEIKLADVICHLGGGKQIDTKNLLGNSSATGGYFLESTVSDNVILEALASSVCMKAGTRVLNFEGPSVRFPSVTMGSAPSWKAEGATGPVSSTTIGAVTLTPCTLISTVMASQEILQDSALVEEAIVQALNNQFAAAVDSAILTGAGGNGPTGITNTANIGTAGATGFVVRNYISDAVYGVRSQNFEPTAVVMSQRSRKELENLADAVNDQPLMGFPYYSGIQMLSTSSILDTMPTGSPVANNGSLILAGDFSQSVLGVRSNIQVSVSEAGDAFDRYMFNIRMVGRFAVSVLNPSAFYTVTDITPR